MKNISAKNICIIGLGFVGLTLAAVLADRGFMVYGVENNSRILDILKRGRIHFFEKDLKKLVKKYLNKKIFIYKRIPQDKVIDSFIVTVGTPIDEKNHKTNLSHIVKATTEIGKNLRDGQLIILRSTVEPGTTREIVLPILKNSGKKFYLSFCPERTIEGAALTELKIVPQIISGLDAESLKMARVIFSRFVDKIIEAPSLEYAEMVKITCNTYRDLTFAYANELAILARKFGIDANKLIEMANTGYSRGGIPKPGFVGGYCLSKDSYILSSASVKKNNFRPKLINTAREINESLPGFVADRIKNKLQRQKSKSGKIFISGFAFKGRPETDDLRGSPAVDLLRELRERKIDNIHGHDFVVSEKNIKKLGIKFSNIEDGFKEAAVVVIMNNHVSYNDLPIKKLILVMKKGGLFFDSWHIFDPRDIKEINHATYESLGFSNESN